jgi:hypothetical protein
LLEFLGLVEVMLLDEVLDEVSFLCIFTIALAAFVGSFVSMGGHMIPNVALFVEHTFTHLLVAFELLIDLVGLVVNEFEGGEVHILVALYFFPGADHVLQKLLLGVLPIQ